MDKKIIIIGSGASGIAAGTKLIEYGYENVLIVEAENRIGGRIHTINFGENILDLGAQWCHGEKNNVVYEIAKNYQHDIFDSTGNIYFTFNCIKSNKEKLSDDVTSKLTELIEKCIDSDEAKDEMKKFNGSFGEYITKKYNDELEKSEYASINKSDAKKFFDFYSKFECSIDAPDTLFDISASGLTKYWECDGDQLLNWKGKGYKTILKILMNSTDDKPYGKLDKKILLNKKVEEIHWKDDDEQGKIYIRCTDGDKIEADHLICTVSLGVLKEKHLILFNPPLPQLKVRAIEGLGIGNVDKMFIEFSSKFWPNNWPGMCLLWEDDDLKMIRERNDNWIEDVFGFFPVDYQPNILCGWIVGVNGRRMEIQSDDDVLNGLMFLLKKFLKWDISEPKNFIRSIWHLNQNFRGSYSYHSVNADKLNTSASDLAYPLTDDQHNGKLLLQFAGEATHDHYFSTVHGAIETGWREAKRLNDYYNNHEKIENMKKFTSTSTTNNSDSKLYVNNDITMDDIMDDKINDDNDDTNNDDNTNNIYDIIILGAGLAGLGAGYCLKQYENEINSKEKSDGNDYDNGHTTNSSHTAGNNRIINNEKKFHKNLKFIILEAQDYIGGRIRTVHMKNNDNHHNINNDHTNIINNKEINEHNNTTSTTTTTTLPSSQPSQNNPSLNLDKFSDIIDSGAQWLHGDHNKLYHIANDYKLLSNEISEEGIGSYICDNGDIIDVNFQNKISYKIGQILEECENFINIYDNNNIKDNDNDNDNDHDDIDDNKKKLVNNKNNDYPKSVGDYLKDKFFKYLKQEEINYIEENYKKYKIMNNDNSININENDDDNNDLIKIKENFYIKYKKNALKIYDWHKRFEIIDNSCLNLEQLSTKYWGLYTLNFNTNVSSSQQAHINFKMGFSTIIYNAILKNFINFLDNIKLNTEICDINWNIMNINNKNYNNLNNYYYYNNYNDDKNINNDYINIKKNKIKYKNKIMNLIRIKTCDNRIYYAKHIIITFSLGVLKSNMHKLFKPNLPDIYMNAIDTIGYETINKIFLQFDIEWWLPMNGIQLLFDDYDNYENCKWTRYISGFDVLKPGAPNTLIGWVGSYGAIEMEKLTDQEIVEDCITLLRKFTKKDVPYPIRYFFSRWNSNRFIRGSYSFLSTKCEKLNITGKFLSEPITLNDLKLMKEIHYKNGSNIVHDDSHNNDDDSHNNNNGVSSSSSSSFLSRDINEKKFYEKSYPLLLFAGEACHEKYFSTAHGAFESGYEQAKKILQFYNE